LNQQRLTTTMLKAILSRWAASQAAAAMPGDEAATTQSPSACPARKSAVNDSLWQSLRRLIPGEADPWSAKLATDTGSRLSAACAAFESCLTGLDEDSATRLSQQIRRSRSLGELWHLRGGLFTALACAHSQSEAQQQLARLGRHFAGLRH